MVLRKIRNGGVRIKPCLSIEDASLVLFNRNVVFFSHLDAALIFLLLFPSREKVRH